MLTSEEKAQIIFHELSRCSVNKTAKTGAEFRSDVQKLLWSIDSANSRRSLIWVLFVVALAVVGCCAVFWNGITQSSDLGKAQVIASLVGPLLTACAAGIALYFTVNNYEKQRKHAEDLARIQRRLDWQREIYTGAYEAVSSMLVKLGKLADIRLPAPEFYDEISKIGAIRLIGDTQTVVLSIRFSAGFSRILHELSTKRLLLEIQCNVEPGTQDMEVECDQAQHKVDLFEQTIRLILPLDELSRPLLIAARRELEESELGYEFHDISNSSNEQTVKDLDRFFKMLRDEIEKVRDKARNV